MLRCMASLRADSVFELPPGGVSSFIINYRIALRDRRYTMGQWPDWTVLDAVKEARILRQRIDRGEDPLEDWSFCGSRRRFSAVEQLTKMPARRGVAARLLLGLLRRPIGRTGSASQI
jgi:hypothetical protein